MAFAASPFVDSRGNTLLHYASFCNRPSRLRELTRLGCDWGALNVDDLRPVDVAYKYSFDKFSAALPSAGRPETGHEFVVRESSAESLGIPSHPTKQHHFNQDEMTKAQSEVKLPDWDSRRSVEVTLDSDETCELCSLEEWINGSKTGSEYVLCSSLDVLLGQQCCGLCQEAGKGLSNAVGKLEKSLEVRVRVMLGTFAPVNDGRDVLRYSILGHAEIDFELWATAFRRPISSNATKPLSIRETFQGRPIDIGSAQADLRDWMSQCADHKECRPHGSQTWPTRVIDLGTTGPEPKPCLWEGLPGDLADPRYVFISFVWGGAPTGLSLTTATYAALHHPWDMAQAA